MRPRGWILLGHGNYVDDPLENALYRLKTSAYGGTACDSSEAQTLLTSAGFANIKTLPTPPGAPGISVGQLVARVPWAEPIEKAIGAGVGAGHTAQEYSSTT